MLNLRLAAFLALAFVPSFTSGQDEKPPKDFPANVTDPPPYLPSSCSASLIANLNIATGSKAYISMNWEITALSLGHDATNKLRAALKKAGSNDTARIKELIDILTGLTDAQNTYLCASFVLGEEPDGVENHRLAKRTAISVYNRLALNTWQLRGQMKKAAENSYSQGAESEASNIKFAEDMASLLEGRKEVVTDLLNATVMNALLSIYKADPNAIKTDTVDVSCSERESLLKDLHRLTGDTTGDEFTRAARVLESFFQVQRCKTI